ncbi:MAG: L,D-transpeptidase family protein [Nitrospiraceae bacterium]|nr:L,D-transpeptidase family protein [Nitrospiraceae bacterium]
MKRTFSFFVLFLLYFALGAFGYDGTAPSHPSAPAGRRTVADVLREIGPRAESHLKPYFEKAGLSYPPSRVTLIGLKDELELEVWAEKDHQWVYVATYDVYGASGGLGPKEKAGDGQVPEGIYRITELNPNSRFHLSMKLDYPNGFDRLMAKSDGRSHLGGDIYLHGKTKSKGCIAVGDQAIEELFVLTARTGIEKVKMVIAPYDLRTNTPHSEIRVSPSWLPKLYETLGQELTKYRPKEAAGLRTNYLSEAEYEADSSGVLP